MYRLYIDSNVDLALMVAICICMDKRKEYVSVIGAHFGSLWTLVLTLRWRFKYTSVIRPILAPWALALTLRWRFRCASVMEPSLAYSGRWRCHM